MANGNMKSMDKKKQYKQVITEKGEALFPHLDKPETYEGAEIGYTITMKFDDEYTQRLIDIINDELEKAKEELTTANQKWSAEPFLGYKMNKNGEMVFKFKTSASIKLRDGSIVSRKVPVFDGYGNKMEDLTFGNGSICKVAFQLVPFYSSRVINGVSLRLVAVQVLKKEEIGGGHSAADFGFTTEEGSYNSKTDEDATPFFDSAEEDASEF